MVLKSEVRKRVEAALSENDMTAEYAIEVIDEDGLVTLKGRVPSAEVKATAEELTEKQEGVVDVTNALVVDPSLAEPDIIVGPPQSTTPSGQIPGPP